MSSPKESTLMRVIGLPNSSAETPPQIHETEFLDIFAIAVKNRVPFYFLDKAKNVYEDFPSLNKLHRVFREKSQAALNLLDKLRKTFQETDVDYVIFKTLKPFPFATVDIDILFLDLQNLRKACLTLLGHGCSLAGYGAYSITLYDHEHGMNVDLQSEIAVSRLVYVNKNYLEKSITTMTLGEKEFPVFDQSIDLALVIAHSFYKEQLFTLADYYTTIVQMANMTKGQRRTLAEFAELTSTELGLKLFLNIVAVLTELVFNEKLDFLASMKELINASGFEKRIIYRIESHIRKCPRLPYKYSPLIVAEVFLRKIAKDSTMRSGLIRQSIEPLKDRNFIKEVLAQARRESY